MLALPGSAYLYQGEELGLPEAVDLPDEARQDPTWFRTAGERYGRDGCRVPLPWAATAPAYGFSPTGASWLPQPAAWAALARDAQVGDPGSTLTLYRTLLARAALHELGSGHARVARRATPAGVARIPQRECDRRGEHGRRRVALPAGDVIARAARSRPAAARRHDGLARAPSSPAHLIFCLHLAPPPQQTRAYDSFRASCRGWSCRTGDSPRLTEGAHPCETRD